MTLREAYEVARYGVIVILSIPAAVILAPVFSALFCFFWLEEQWINTGRRMEGKE